MCQCKGTICKTRRSNWGSISSTLYEQLLWVRIPKAQKILTTLLNFYAFRICTHKSFSWSIFVSISNLRKLFFVSFLKLFQITICRALGQGAFGEVYQGFYKKSSSDSLEMSVAVKTLPELSSNQVRISIFPIL